jgi:hypothetical protein
MMVTSNPVSVLPIRLVRAIRQRIDVLVLLQAIWCGLCQSRCSQLATTPSIGNRCVFPLFFEAYAQQNSIDVLEIC